MTDRSQPASTKSDEGMCSEKIRTTRSAFAKAQRVCWFSAAKFMLHSQFAMSSWRGRVTQGFWLDVWRSGDRPIDNFSVLAPFLRECEYPGILAQQTNFVDIIMYALSLSLSYCSSTFIHCMDTMKLSFSHDLLNNRLLSGSCSYHLIINKLFLVLCFPCIVPCGKEVLTACFNRITSRDGRSAWYSFPLWGDVLGKGIVHPYFVQYKGLLPIW